MSHVTKPIARSPNCRIDQCSCGAVHISVGGTTIRIQEGVARELQHVLAASMHQIDQARTQAPSFHLVPSIVAPPDDDELH
jgi:hypothetical protein